jgi:EAL domain-containing protein (putative c-di-GMP-specific phosphodiesterase class I)
MLKPFRVADIRTQLERLKDGHGTITSASLLLAIKGNQLQLMYQPKIDMRSLALTGFEGLVRWQHPARGLLGPADFFHIADENVMDPLTKAVIAIGLEQLAAWQAAEIPGGLSLNISAHNLHEVDFADNLVQVCQRFGVAPGQLTLELTETAATEDTLKAMDILTRLRLKGFRLSIDDFGMGYSSLSQLHRLPFSEMKVDREFVSKCHTSRDARTIVRTIVRLAHELGMKAVAEGVENDEIMKILGDLDCDEAQGYHICRPLQPDQIPEFLETWRLKVGAAVPSPISVRRQLGR